jgi:hypothetical protein
MLGMATVVLLSLSNAKAEVESHVELFVHSTELSLFKCTLDMFVCVIVTRVARTLTMKKMRPSGKVLQDVTESRYPSPKTPVNRALLLYVMGGSIYRCTTDQLSDTLFGGALRAFLQARRKTTKHDIDLMAHPILHRSRQRQISEICHGCYRHPWFS